jgi:hypothetical protein
LTKEEKMKKIVGLLILAFIFTGSLYSDPSDAQIRQAANTLGIPFEDLRQFIQSYRNNSLLINDNSSKSINDLLEYLSKYFTLSDRSEKFFGMIGAIDGCGIELNGSEIEIYKYDLKDPGQKTIIENAQKTNTMTVMGFTVPVLVNGTFIITNYSDHPEKNKLVEIFKRL